MNELNTKGQITRTFHKRIYSNEGCATEITDIDYLKMVFEDIGIKFDLLTNNIIQYYDVTGSDLHMFHFDENGKYKFND